MKCDFCGSKSKVKTRSNFPHGKKSRGITTRICRNCETKQHNPTHTE